MKCLLEYRKHVAAHVAAAEAAFFVELARSEDDNIRSIGEAGLSGDYSKLAI